MNLKQQLVRYYAMLLLAFCSMCSSLAGCSLCPPGFIDDYATVGGKWERLDPTTGRVGSPMSSHDATISNEMILAQPNSHYPIHSEPMRVYSESMQEYSEPMEVHELIESEWGTPTSIDTTEVVPQYEGSSIILGDEW